MIKAILLGVISLLWLATSWAQTTKNVLFIGNSYTYVNDLPQLLSNVANSAGDQIVFDSSAPGGYTFEGHTTNSVTLDKISQGDWDVVVLQEQSQRPAFPIGQVEAEVFPFAAMLDDMINENNSCAETMFYMTWGRKNGDASNCGFYEPLCTYAGMDSLLSLRYQMMAEMNEAVVSPVGAVWRYIREQHPLIELYSSDESHPSLAGSYAAACSFYTSIFRKDPENITYESGLNAIDAANIRSAVSVVVFDSLQNWLIGTYDPMAEFSSLIVTGSTVQFTNTSENSTSYTWDFGDGETSTEPNPTHTFATNSNFTVTLTASQCDYDDSVEMQIDLTGSVGLSENHLNQPSKLEVFPNPANDLINVTSILSFPYFVEIHTLGGQLIFSKQVTDSNSTLSIQNLASGTYIFSATNDQEMRRCLLVKN
jgi:PKD repeat protein